MNKYLAILLLCCGIFSACTCAQGQARETRFLKLGVNEGLSQNSVRSIFQDRQGFIWIGTGDGLNRYDGKQIRKYRQNFRDKGGRGFPGKIVNGKIWQDERQQLWMIVDGQLVRMDPFTEQFYMVRDIGAELECLILGITGDEVLISTPQQVVAVHRLNSTVRPIPVTGAIGLYAPAGRDPYLLLTRSGGLYRYSLRHHNLDLMYAQEPGLMSCHLLNAAAVGIVAGNRFLEYSLREERIVSDQPLPPGTAAGNFTPLLKAPDGDIVAMSLEKGLMLVDSASGNVDSYSYREGNLSGISSNLIYTGIIDRSGNLWLGTEGGGVNILNLKPRLFQAFPTQAIDNGERSLLMVKSIYYRDGSIYIGTFNRGLYVVDPSSMAYRRLFLPSSGQFGGVYFIREDRQGRIWMNQGARVGVADMQAGRFLLSAELPYRRNGRQHNIPQCFEQIADRAYLVGTVQSTYLLRESAGQIQVTDLGLKEPLLQTDIQSIIRKDDAEILVGRGEGGGYVAIRITPDDQVQVTGKGLDKVTIKSIYPDKQSGRTWFATHAGILVQQPGSDRNVLIDERDGLSNDYIYAIVPQDDHTFWVSTNKGLNRIVLKAGPQFAVDHVEQYSLQHGLQSNEFNTGAYFKHGHMLFFGGVTGINWFDERKFFKRAFTAAAYVTDLLVNEQPYRKDTAVNFLKQVRLGHRENNLMLRFAALDFTNAAVNQYRHQLLGYDKQWISAHTTGEARYSKLPYGDYVFRVMSANSEGVWSAPRILLHISIAPPFWLTWWFILLSAAVALALLIAGGRYYLRRKVKAQLQIVERQLAVNNERLRISRDMHDELGTGLSKIALLSEIGKTGSNPDKGQRIIREISATSRDLADKMGEIIWTLNPEHDTLSNLAAYLKEYISELTDPLPLQLHCRFPDTIPELPIGHKYRQQLLLVTKEAVNNALKYAQATELWFDLELGAGAIVFTIRDNGKGFVPEALVHRQNGKRNGLTNMRKRMEGIGGHFSVSSHEGDGTSVRYGIIY